MARARRADTLGVTLQEVQILLQTISSGAIAMGLIYSGMQFRNYRRAAHVANFTKLVEMQLQLRRIRVDHPEFASVHRHDVENLGTPREIQEYFLNLMQLSLFEIAWFSHKHGQLPEDYFRSWERRMEVVEREESFRKMWGNPSMKIMHDEFHQYLQGIMDRSDQKRGGT